MSLSKEPVYSELKNHFVLGYRNIMGEPYAGNSGTHKPTGNAVDTTNGAGSHNIQMFVMNPDGTVVHCMLGFWNAQDLVGELALGRKLNELYLNREMTPTLKAQNFSQLQLQHVSTHPMEMVARSHMQGFDMKREAHRPNSDTIKDRSLLGEEWGPGSCEAFKTTDVIMHERMSKRAFMNYGAFDVAKYADYGTDTYDKHEDSLDENGSKVTEEMKFEPIKNARSIQEAQKSCTMKVMGGPAAHAPSACNITRRRPSAAVIRKTYVKDYGRLRPPTTGQM